MQYVSANINGHLCLCVINTIRHTLTCCGDLCVLVAVDISEELGNISEEGGGPVRIEPA